MKVSRAQIVARGLTHRCPNCGAAPLFRPGRLFELNKTCPTCGFVIERANDEGFFLGSMSLNYGVTFVGFLAPVMILAYREAIGTATALALGGIGAILIPSLLYRPSRSWWLMNYYFFLPQHLPANGGKGRAGEDENF